MVMESEPGARACTSNPNGHTRTWSLVTLYLRHRAALVLQSPTDTNITIVMIMHTVNLRVSGQAAIIYRLLNSTQIHYTARDSVF